MRVPVKSVGKHTPETIEMFWRMLSEGWSYKHMARAMGVSVWTLTDWRHFKTQPRINMAMARKYGFVGVAA